MISAFMPIAFVHRWTHLERGWMLAVPTVANAVVYEGSTAGDVLFGSRAGKFVGVRARCQVGNPSLAANPPQT